MHSVRIEIVKLILVGTRITYQATGDAGFMYNKCRTTTPLPHTIYNASRPKQIWGRWGLGRGARRATLCACYNSDGMGYVTVLLLAAAVIGHHAPHAR